MTDRTAIYETVVAQIEPFNKKGVPLSDATTFQGDLEWDSLTVMDFVAAIEDEHDPALRHLHDDGDVVPVASDRRQRRG